MECKLCHIQYVGKAETTLNLRLITTEKTQKKPKVILACKQFEKQVHTLCKIPSFHLISWCRNFVERHSFRIVLGNSLISASLKQLSRDITNNIIVRQNILDVTSWNRYCVY